MFLLWLPNSVNPVWRTSLWRPIRSAAILGIGRRR